eukprot:COSAG02_NODE_45_length_45811_cov_83.565891_33_plen_43_part_00
MFSRCSEGLASLQAFFSCALLLVYVGALSVWESAFGQQALEW